MYYFFLTFPRSIVYVDVYVYVSNRDLTVAIQNLCHARFFHVFEQFWGFMNFEAEQETYIFKIYFF